MIVIIADGREENIGRALYQYYKEKSEEAEFVSVSDLDLKPCYGCDENRCKENGTGGKSIH